MLIPIDFAFFSEFGVIDRLNETECLIEPDNSNLLLTFIALYSFSCFPKLEQRSLFTLIFQVLDCPILICQFNGIQFTDFSKIVTIYRVKKLLIHNASKNCNFFKGENLDPETTENEILTL